MLQDRKHSQTYSQAHKRACSRFTERRERVRETQADWRRDRLQAGRQRYMVILKDRQTGGLAVVSICDNNSSNVIIGSLIKINLISATHNTFCPLKRYLPLWGCLYLALTSVLGDPITRGLLGVRLFTPGSIHLRTHRFPALYANKRIRLPVKHFFTQRKK